MRKRVRTCSPRSACSPPKSCIRHRASTPVVRFPTGGCRDLLLRNNRPIPRARRCQQEGAGAAGGETRADDLAAIVDAVGMAEMPTAFGRYPTVEVEHRPVLPEEGR